MKNILDNIIQEHKTKITEQHQPTGKFTFAFDNRKTNFQGEIKKDGYLYLSTEMGKNFKAGPLAKVPTIGQGMVTIDKKGTIENVYFGKTLLQFVPNFVVKQIN